jgi:hypothetical protein
MMKYLATFFLLLTAIVIVLSLRAPGESIPVENLSGDVSSAGEIIALASGLMRFGPDKGSKGDPIGQVTIATGSIQSGSFLEGASYSSVGSVVTITEGDKVVFSGAFVGPITWFLIRKDGPSLTYELTGNIEGTLADGKKATGSVVEGCWGYNSEYSQGFGHVGEGIITLVEK